MSENVPSPLACPVASVRNSRSTGTQMPSLSPTFHVEDSRARISGTAWFDTTALPRAASVGASMVCEQCELEQREPSQERRACGKTPAGWSAASPISRSRIGTFRYRVSTPRLAMDAS